MKKIYKLLLIFLIVIFSICSIFGIYVFICISKLDKKLLSGNNLLDSFLNNLEFYDSSDIKVQNTSLSGKEIAKLNELPEYVKYAFISIEDKEFYKHNGLNIKRIITAIFENLASGYAKSGASTISQQLIKNIHLTSEKSLERKIQEAYLTKKLEKQYTKDEILETYLNVIYFGNNCIGLENAAQKYFDCKSKDLTIAQSATLAGILKSPILYSPTENPQNSIERRNLVLSEMQKDGYITKEEEIIAKNSNLELKLQPNVFNNNSYFSECLKEAKDILKIEENEIALSSYKIYTFLDCEAQNNTINNLKESSKTLKNGQALSTVILDNETYGIVSLVSSNDISIKRQPGSLLKPLLCYAPAFEQGILSPLTPIDDSELKYDNWHPKNADDNFDGYISVREALYRSKNIPAIKTLEYVGIDNAKHYLEKMGIDFDATDNHLALALGAMRYGVNALELTSCYSIFTNKGQYGGYHFIRKITDQYGNIIYNYTIEKNQIFDEATCYLISDILADTATKGTAKNLSKVGIKLSAKTGTVGNNSGNTDAWCMSYNKKYTICCWIGNISGKDENNLNNNENGGTIATNLNALIWSELKKIDAWLTKPTKIKTLSIDFIDYNEKHILNLASSHTPQEYIIQDLFNVKYAPTNESVNFKEVEPPNLTAINNDENIIFYWNQFDFLTYDLYYNDQLFFENVSSPLTIQSPNISCDFYILAKNKYIAQIQKSNIIHLYYR